MPKEKPKLYIGTVIRNYRTGRGLSQGDIERRTGLLRCYLSRVENGHTVPSLETLAKIADAIGISLADFFPAPDTPEEREARRLAEELTEEELWILTELKRCTDGLAESDKELVLALIRRVATVAAEHRRSGNNTPSSQP